MCSPDGEPGAGTSGTDHMELEWLEGQALASVWETVTTNHGLPLRKGNESGLLRSVVMNSETLSPSFFSVGACLTKYGASW